MGMFTAKLKVWHPVHPDQVGEFELWVDTGAAYSWISRKRLEALGIQPTGRREFRTIEGRTIERDMAAVLVAADGQIGGDTVAMAEPGDMEVMGAFTLGSLALSPDVIQKKLVPIKVSLALRAG
ncbi:MAG: aspartyl protease family protein [Terriglobia bacterium]